jgi:hypothetical protein
MKWHIPSLASAALVVICLGTLQQAKADLDSPKNAVDAPGFDAENHDQGHHRHRNRNRNHRKHQLPHKTKETCKCIEDTQMKYGV